MHFPLAKIENKHSIATYLNRLGDSPALPVLNIATTLLSDISTFLTSDVLVSCLLHLAAILYWLLGALLGGHRLVNSLLDIPTLLLRHTATLLLRKLMGETGEGYKKAGGEDSLHLRLALAISKSKD